MGHKSGSILLKSILIVHLFVKINLRISSLVHLHEPVEHENLNLEKEKMEEDKNEREIVVHGI